MNGSKRGHDPFELYELQARANIKRMKLEKRLNSKQSQPPIKETQPNDFKQVRKPLQEIPNSLTNIVRNTKERDASGPKTNISMKNLIKNLHLQQSLGSQQTSRTPISKVISMTDSKGFIRTQRNGLNNRFSDISKSILNTLPTKGNEPTMMNTAFVKAFIEWFKINRYDYNITNPETENIRNRLINDSPQRTTSEQRTPVVTNQFKKIDEVSNPTHIVVESRMIGKFLYCAKLRCTRTGTGSTAILPRTDTRFEVHKDDLLVLPDRPSNNQNILGVVLPVFYQWKILHGKPMDVNFFA
ncbi:uncharacterized protein CANTADRAFT_233137 [Suhomyces tanzawaensis NRRL Y-17324]|uniref:Uncharacterized protein n=1 Tax=Suhomyces tanzawaensis NRRL Y-17324 TaxID=984487 RepID=A0A1E4SLD4_9ASCO|nr:uncharacterized protein CANTADRAFT_233137 [Suhomyces tanzawaensis NRRL Y-17324]ODV80335.1 hypothetical protein CANTADRAFT_233137 [Suhomyces tanzawaensis NRRL Y-17324]